RDRERFLGYLDSASERYKAIIHTYSLMDNHYHILLQTPAGNLSQIMHHINGAYTKLFQISTCQLCRPDTYTVFGYRKIFAFVQLCGSPRAR
ncbi:MAG: transposase, partial [Pseudomonadota bacterium]